ncbi:MAG: hypothetical protein Q9191_008010 [Dirinaria sp. TL-2023a]
MLTHQAHSSSHGERIEASEARVLQKLNELQLEFQQGKRAAPAFSLVTVENVGQEETWKSITTELENTELEAGTISSNQRFIRSWIDEVFLADVDGSMNEIPEASHSSPKSSALELSREPPHSASSNTVAIALDMERIGLEPTHKNRPVSASSHRSKDSNWRPASQPNVFYVQSLLKKIFNLEYDDSDTLPMKRVYNQLDWRNRGFLSRTDVESHLLQAKNGTSFAIANETLVRLVNAGDTDRNGRIDCAKFIRICTELVDGARETRIRIANLSGGREARLEREWLSEEKGENLPLPFQYEAIAIDGNLREYLNTATGYSSPQAPGVDPRSFSAMAFTAARVIVPRLSLSPECLCLEPSSEDCIRSCDLVCEAALQFTVLEGDSGPLGGSDLDLITSTFYAEIPVYRGHPNTKLEIVQQEYYELLQNIQGFVSSLRCPTLRDRELELYDIITDVEVRLQKTKLDAFPAAWNNPVDSCFILAYPCPSGWELTQTAKRYFYFQESDMFQKTIGLPPQREVDMNGLRLPKGWSRALRRAGESAAERVCYQKEDTSGFQWSTPLYQGEFKREAEPKSTDYQLFERDFEQLDRVTEWDTDVHGSKLTESWVRRRDNDSGRMYHVNLSSGKVISVD